MAVKSRRYWDANAFIAWLAQETVDDREERCRPVIRAAERGGVVIVTSSLTLVEVIHLRGHPSITEDKDEMIRRFFDHEYIVVRQLDRRTAELARSIIWKEKFDPKDAVHVATALLGRVDQLDTFDAALCAKSGQIGNPPLIIGWPELPEQLEMDLKATEGEADDGEENEGDGGSP